MRGARRPASRKSARPTFPRRKGASGTCWRSSRIQETLGGRSSIETTLAVLRFRNRLVIEAWLGARLRQRRGRAVSAARACRAMSSPRRLIHCSSRPSRSERARALGFRRSTASSNRPVAIFASIARWAMARPSSFTCLALFGAVDLEKPKDAIPPCTRRNNPRCGRRCDGADDTLRRPRGAGLPKSCWHQTPVRRSKFYNRIDGSTSWCAMSCYRISTAGSCGNRARLST